MSARVLLTGATGFLGRYLDAEFRRRGAEVVTAGRTAVDFALDLDDLEGIAPAVAGQAFDLVVNAAAVSRMGECQAQPTAALRINGRAPGILAKALGCRFVQVSTDLVFAGDTAPYSAASEPKPLSVYGLSKAAGEELEVPDWLVVRLPLLFGASADGTVGATDMLRAGVEAKERVLLFQDEFRTPLHAADAARAVCDLGLDPEQRGIRHAAGTERVSRWELAKRFCAIAGLDIHRFGPGVCEDPRRPKDVSLVPDWSPGRSLDAALADS